MKPPPLAMQRVLPAILCAAVVYPMAGLSMGAPSGPFHTALFVASLCLSNLLGCANLLEMQSPQNPIVPLESRLIPSNILAARR
jgi:hypothetical protein